jgi:hypothetical protein
VLSIGKQVLETSSSILPSPRACLILTLRFARILPVQRIALCTSPYPHLLKEQDLLLVLFKASLLHFAVCSYSMVIFLASLLSVLIAVFQFLQGGFNGCSPLLRCCSSLCLSLAHMGQFICDSRTSSNTLHASEKLG